MRLETLVTSRILCNFISEVIFIVLPIAAIIGVQVHGPAVEWSIFSEKELPIASILLCGSAIRRRYMLNYKQIGQRLTEDLFVMDVLIALLTASSLLFSFVALTKQYSNYMEQAEVVMFLISLALVYVVCQVEEKTYQYLRNPPIREDLTRFFRVFRGQMVQVENSVDACTYTALTLTADLLAPNHSSCETKGHVEDLQLEINLDHIRNIADRFEIIERRSEKARKHLIELEKSLGDRQMNKL